MKKHFFYLAILTGTVLFSLNTSAQKTRETGVSPKPPVATGDQLQTARAGTPDPVVSPAVTENGLHSTADHRSSQGMPLIIKANDQQQQIKVNQVSGKPLPGSVQAGNGNLLLPNKSQQEIPDSKSGPAPIRIGQ